MVQGRYSAGFGFQDSGNSPPLCDSSDLRRNRGGWWHPGVWGGPVSWGNERRPSLFATFPRAIRRFDFLTREVLYAGGVRGSGTVPPLLPGVGVHTRRSPHTAPGRHQPRLFRSLFSF